MHRTRPRVALPRVAALAAVTGLVVACGGGHTEKPTQADRDCTAVTQAANGLRVVDGSTATASDAERSSAAAADLTTAAANATTAVAAPAGQLATAAKTYADALARHDIEGVNVGGGLVRQRAQAVADACKTTVLGVSPKGPAQVPNG
jgi:hypothetical protein